MPQNTITARRFTLTPIARGLLLAALTAGPALLPGTGLAQEAPAAAGSELREYAIPPGPLDQALNAFASRAGLVLAVDGALTAGKTSPGLQGEYTPAQALRHLLAGTGLDYRFREGGTVTLVRASSEGQADGAADLGPVVVSATRRATPVSELTRSVTVVSREEVEQQKRIDRSVGEILAKSVPGFSPSTEALTDFGQTLRGRNFLTLIDGMPQSTPLRDGRRSLNTIDADAIERIEVVRGGTAVYGFGATGGLVNIITKRPEPGAFNGHSEAGIKLSTTEYDDSLEWHTNHQVSGRRGEVDYLLNGTYVQREGFFDADGDRIPADPFGVQGGLADTDEYNLMGKIGTEFDDGLQRIELSFNRYNIEQDSEFAGLGNGDPSQDIKTPAVRGNINAKDPGTENTTVNLTYRHEDFHASAVEAQLYYGDLTTRYSKFPGFSQAEITSEKTGARLTIDTPLEMEAQALNLIWGLDFLHDKTAQPALDGPTTTPEMEQDAIAGFAQLELPVGEVGLLRGGVRHEAIRVDVDDVLNRQGVFVNGGELDFNETLFNLSGIAYLTDTLELYGGFSQGFSLADIGRAISDTTATRAEALESEVQTVDNYEIGLRAFGERWDGSLTAFYSESDNGTTFNQNLVISKQPEQIYGVELAANATVTRELEVGGTASWLEGEVDLDDDGDYDEDLPSTRVPPFKLTAYAEYSPTHWWNLRLQALHSGDRDPDSTQFGGGEVDNYTLFDLNAGFDLGGGRGQLQVGVENLFNEDYFTVLSQAGQLPYAYSKGPGRTVSLTYSLDW